ncbi:hypothetical protein BH10PLA2_BH10PLA2_30350 [soil metagenome]
MHLIEPHSLRRGHGQLSGVLVLAVCLVQGVPAWGQSSDQPPRLRGMFAAGARSYLSERPGTLDFGIVNRADQGIQTRVVSFYGENMERQYGRDVWVPAKSTLHSWFRVGPPLDKPVSNSVEMRTFFYEKVGNSERLIKSPNNQPFHSTWLPFQKDAITSLMLDADIEDGSGVMDSPEKQLETEELREFIRVFRHGCDLSPIVNSIKQQFLPPIPEAFDGIDQFVLASDRLSRDTLGQRALRGWLEQGGHLWIPVDHVAQETITSLLGDVLDFQIVNRVSLTDVALTNSSGRAYFAEKQSRAFEQPIQFVRVLAPGQQVFYTLDGWPAASAATVGKGKVIFTMLGARAWFVPRTRVDTPSRFAEFPNLPVATTAFQYVIDELQIRKARPAISDKAIKAYINDQIGYQVVERRWVTLVFGGLFLVLLAGAVALSRRSLLEHLGWIGPCLALVASGAFVFLGTQSRSAIPPTLAVLQMVDAVPGVDAIPASGTLGSYQPVLNETSPGATRGGEFNLDLTELEGKIETRLQEDIGRWHFEKLELPTGVRLGKFQYAVPTGQPIDASLRFGKQGIEGRLAVGPFQNLEDALLVTPGGHFLPVTLGDDGAIRVGDELSLQTGQFISSGLVSDRQRLHQSIYQELLASPLPAHLAESNTLLAWANPLDMHFTLGQGAKLVGASLLSIPVRLETPAPNTPVVIPAAFVDCRRIGQEVLEMSPATSFRYEMKIPLRFQLPANVLPFVVESGRLAIKMRARARTVDLFIASGADRKPLKQLISPFGLEEIELDKNSLQFDEQGRLTVFVDVGKVKGEEARDQWNLDWVGLEVRGQARTR